MNEQQKIGMFRRSNLTMAPQKDHTSARAKEIVNELGKHQNVIEEIVQITKTPGLCFGIIYNHKVIHSQSLGLADISGNLACSSDTLFEISSLTKPFTATACAVLALDGILDWGETLNCRMKDPSLIIYLR